MIYKTWQIAAFGGVHNRARVNAEHVATANTLRVVVLLAYVRHGLANDFAHVFDNKLLSTDLLERKQAPVVDVWLAEAERLFAELKHRKWSPFNKKTNLKTNETQLFTNKFSLNS